MEVCQKHYMTVVIEISVRIKAGLLSCPVAADLKLISILHNIAKMIYLKIRENRVHM